MQGHFAYCVTHVIVYISNHSRPCNFYKNQIALSLVKSYPITAAESNDTPQALWFHPHARGINRHAGRIHYRMEYLARKSKDRVTKRRRLDDQGEDASFQDISPSEHDDIGKAEIELKFIIPNSQMKSRIIDLWNATFKKRHQFRIDNQFIEYAVNFPVYCSHYADVPCWACRASIVRMLTYKTQAIISKYYPGGPRPAPGPCNANSV